MSNKINLEFNENFKGGTTGLGNFLLGNQAPTTGQNLYNYEFPTQTSSNYESSTQIPTTVEPTSLKISEENEKISNFNFTVSPFGGVFKKNEYGEKIVMDSQGNVYDGYDILKGENKKKKLSN